MQHNLRDLQSAFALGVDSLVCCADTAKLVTLVGMSWASAQHLPPAHSNQLHLPPHTETPARAAASLRWHWVQDRACGWNLPRMPGLTTSKNS